MHVHIWFCLSWFLKETELDYYLCNQSPQDGWTSVELDTAYENLFHIYCVKYPKRKTYFYSCFAFLLETQKSHEKLIKSPLR